MLRFRQFRVYLLELFEKRLASVSTQGMSIISMRIADLWNVFEIRVGEKSFDRVKSVFSKKMVVRTPLRSSEG